MLLHCDDGEYALVVIDADTPSGPYRGVFGAYENIWHFEQETEFDLDKITGREDQ